MKHTCPKCRETINIPESRMLDYVERSGAFRARIESLLAKLRGSAGGKRCLQTMTPEQRRARARNAVAAREAKRQEKKPN